MPNTSTVSVDASKSLADLNTLVAQEEHIHGALLTIGNDGASTLLQFDNTQQKPTKHAQITADVGGNSDSPAGTVSFTRGSVFIAGNLTPSSASR